MNQIKHAMSPNGRGYQPRCGAVNAEVIAIFAEDVMCPACIEAISSSSALRSGLRQAVEKGQGSVGLVVMDLSIWEGRGDWASLPMEYRDQCGRQAYTHLEKTISALEGLRAQLEAVLQMEGNTPA